MNKIAAPAESTEAADIAITLPLSSWRIVVSHLRRGICQDVEATLAAIYVQAEPQIEEANRRAEALAQAAPPATPPQAPPDDKTDQLLRIGSETKLH